MIRALGVTTLQRSSFLKDVPTLDESGLKGFDLTTWWGVMAPARTSDAVVDRLAGEIARAMELPDIKERFAAMGSEAPTVRSPREFTSFVEKELKIYSQLVKRSGATID